MNKFFASVVLILLVGCGAATDDAATPGLRAAPATAKASPTRQVSLAVPSRAGKAAAVKHQPLQRIVEYYDGEFRRTLWLSEDTVLDMDAVSAEAAILTEAPESAGTSSEMRGGRTWKVGRGRADAVAVEVARRGHRISPVLHMAGTEGAPMVGLPGGVIVTVPPDWSCERVAIWASNWGHSVEKVVQSQMGMYLIATGPGLESIELANRMHESGEILAATPNMLRFAATR